jgi:fructokinase
MGGLLAALHHRDWLDRDRLETLSAADLAAALDFALGVSAITVSRIGADPPRRADLPERFR